MDKLFEKEPEYNKYGYATLAVTPEAYLKLKTWNEALEKIADYQMPKMIIRPWEVTKENVAELCQVIQDMAGIAQKSLESNNDK